MQNLQNLLYSIIVNTLKNDIFKLQDSSAKGTPCRALQNWDIFHPKIVVYNHALYRNTVGQNVLKLKILIQNLWNFAYSIIKHTLKNNISQ